MKEIVEPVLEIIYAIELLGSMSTDEAWRHLHTLDFYYREYMYMHTKVVEIHWILL